jgi:hypothetical protein
MVACSVSAQPPSPNLEIVRVQASRPSAELAHFLPSAAESVSLFAEASGRQRLVRTRKRLQPDGSTLWIADAFALEDSGQATRRALDRTLFGSDASSLSELARQRERGGPNLHAAPIRLPGRLELGRWVTPLPGVLARVRLDHAARVELRLGGRRLELEAVCLVAEEGAVEREQWLAADLGEIALGDRGAPAARWLIGHGAAPTTPYFEAVAPALCLGPWPQLPAAGSSDAPRDPKRSLL